MTENPKLPSQSNTARLKKIKKILSVFGIIFVLFIIPATVNLALSSQDPRRSAQTIDDGAAFDKVAPVENKPQTKTQENGFQNFLWKVYPFGLGIIVLIWGSLIIVYFGLKFRNNS
jgi:hypothetical protein